MNSTLYYHCCIWGFYLLPPIVLWVKFFQPKVPWLVILSVIILLGWVLTVGRVNFYYAMLWDEIQTYQSQGLQAPAQLLDIWAADGAKRVFSLLFGWLPATLYFVPWYCVYYLLNNRNNRKQVARK